MILNIYVDGSFHAKSKTTSWAFIAVKNGNIIYKCRGDISGPITDMHQIGGELKATMEAARWAKKNNYKIKIFHDLQGIHYWIKDKYMPFGKAWAANNQFVKQYVEYMQKFTDTITEFQWVKGHQKNVNEHSRWNNEVDKIVKYGYVLI